MYTEILLEMDRRTKLQDHDCQSKTGQKSARIRVSFRPIHGVSHTYAAVSLVALNGDGKDKSGACHRLQRLYGWPNVVLKLWLFEYRMVLTTKLLWSIKNCNNIGNVPLARKKTPGPYSKPFLNLLFDQLKVSPLHGTAQIVRTTRTERGRKIGALTHRVGKRWFIVTVWLYNEEYCWRAFDPQNQRTYRGTVVRCELEKRLNRYDAVGTQEQYRRFPLLSKKAFGWVLGKMVVYDRYAMQAFWKSPVYDEGVLILDQQEDVMAMRIQCGFRCMLARGNFMIK